MAQNSREPGDDSFSSWQQKDRLFARLARKPRLVGSTVLIAAGIGLGLVPNAIADEVGHDLRATGLGAIGLSAIVGGARRAQRYLPFTGRFSGTSEVERVVLPDIQNEPPRDYLAEAYWGLQSLQAQGMTPEEAYQAQLQRIYADIASDPDQA